MMCIWPGKLSAIILAVEAPPVMPATGCQYDRSCLIGVECWPSEETGDQVCQAGVRLGSIGFQVDITSDLHGISETEKVFRSRPKFETLSMIRTWLGTVSLLHLQATLSQHASATERPMASTRSLLSTWPSIPSQQSSNNSIFSDLSGNAPGDSSSTGVPDSWGPTAGESTGALAPVGSPFQDPLAPDALQSWQQGTQEAAPSAQSSSSSIVRASAAATPDLEALTAWQQHVAQAATSMRPHVSSDAPGPLNTPNTPGLDVLRAWQQGQQEQAQVHSPLLRAPAVRAAVAKGLPLAELAFPGGMGALLEDLGSMFAAQMLQRVSSCADRDSTLDLGMQQVPGRFGILCADRPVGVVIAGALTTHLARLADLHDQIAAIERHMQDQLAKNRLQRLQVGKDLVAKIIRPTLQQYARLLRPMSLLQMGLLQQGVANGSARAIAAGDHLNASPKTTVTGSAASSSPTEGSQAGYVSAAASHAGLGGLARSTATGTIDWWELALPMGLAGLLLAFGLAGMLYFRYRPLSSMRAFGEVFNTASLHVFWHGCVQSLRTRMQQLPGHAINSGQTGSGCLATCT